MSIASAIAVSGLNVASLRLQVAASNIANSLSTGPLPATNAANAVNFPAAYSALRVNQTDAAGGGTSATVATITPATVYEPTAPFADDNCMVAGPNVDRANELLQLLVARYTFAANAQVIRADAQMSASLLNITA